MHLNKIVLYYVKEKDFLSHYQTKYLPKSTWVFWIFPEGGGGDDEDTYAIF